MSSPPLATAAARLLAKEPISAPPAMDDKRPDLVRALRGELAARSRRRARRRWLAPAAAAAGLLLVAGAAIWAGRGAPNEAASRGAPRPQLIAGRVHGEVFVVRRGAASRVALSGRDVLASGDRIVTAEGDATIAFDTGTRLDVERTSELSVDRENGKQLVHLDTGAVTAMVAKLHGDEQFIVHTGEADVEVRGTVFRVARSEDPACGSRTRVHVTEGHVTVRDARGELALAPGDGWVSPCVERAVTPLTAPPTALVTASSRPAVAPPPSAHPPTRPSPVAVDAPMSASDLAAQNALFADAMAAKGRGDNRSSVAALDALLTRYPETPLREAAEAQRMKALASVDPVRAASLAKQYLSRYPRGFARADAERIVAAEPARFATP